MGYIPKYKLNNKMVSLVADISRIIGSVSALSNFDKTLNYAEQTESERFMIHWRLSKIL